MLPTKSTNGERSWRSLNYRTSTSCSDPLGKGAARTGAATTSPHRLALLSITFDTESGDVLQETYYSYNEDIGGYGELQTSPEGIVVPGVLVLDDEGGETWEPTSDVGVFADLPSLSYELRPLAAGTLLQIELGVTDFGDNDDIVSAEVEVP